VGEEPVMVDPKNANEGEAYDERNIRWPLPRQQGGEWDVVNVAFQRHFELQHQQGDGDGEHAIGKSFNAAGFFIHV
jgi:hypothetical protein